MTYWQWRITFAALLPWALIACAPSLDWRELRPEGMHLSFAMPCKPSRYKRDVALLGKPHPMQLLACQAEGATFGLGHMRLDDALQAGRALTALADAAHRNIGAAVQLGEPVSVPGMTPFPQARQWQWVGAQQDGQPVYAWVTVFAYGPHVYQASVIGRQVDQALVLQFRAALAIRPDGTS